MRFLLEVRIPLNEGNEGLLSGILLKQMNTYLVEVKPESIYFGVKDGQRTVFLVVNIDSPDMIPEILEPLWLDLKADVFITPVMNAEDFEKASLRIEKIVRKRQ